MRTKIAAGAALLLLVAFPIYHHLGAPADVLQWGPPTVWGANASTVSETLFRFGEAEHKDQGVSFHLHHRRTRALGLETGARLHMVAACPGGGCTVEVRIIASNKVARSVKWPEVSLGDGFVESAVPVPQSVVNAGAVKVNLVLVRDRAGGPKPDESVLFDLKELEFRSDR